MKAKILLNTAVFALVLCGVILKATHSPGASISLLLGGILMLVSVLIYVPREMSSIGSTGLRQIVPTVMGSLLILGLMFRMQNWPGASILVALGTALTVVYAFQLVRSNGELKFSSQFVTTMVLFLVMLGGLLPNNAWAMVLGSALQ